MTQRATDHGRSLDQALDLARGHLVTAALGVKVLAGSGVIRPYAPWRLARLGVSVARWGVGLAGGFLATAVREPHRAAVVDDEGTLTYGELAERARALAAAWRELGVQEADLVAVLCRNHRYFLDASMAAALLGADILYVNTAFARPQVHELLARERPALVVHDQEFAGLVTGLEKQGIVRVVAWVDQPARLAARIPTVAELVTLGRRTDLSPPDHRSRVVLLTSGTTGAPRGAPRSEGTLEAAVALLDRMPLRFGRRVHIAAPLFHTWGFAHLGLSLLLGSTMVLRRRFDAADCLRTVELEGCEAVAVVPVMLQRILALPEDVLGATDWSAVRVVAASGSALPGDLAPAWMDRFGEHLYSVYGSTEVAYAGIAVPSELRAAPDTAGRPPHGTVVRILDEHGHELPPGETGRIFVGNSMLFEGYSGGGRKEVRDGLMSTGDVGRIDSRGLLFVAGRDDEMIVSGGENVFPREVEDCLSRHPGVHEAAVIGVPDAEFGQRLRAYVVLDDPAAQPDDLQAWVRDQLARFKVPREVVVVAELPRNATGKVVKRDLPPG